MGDSFLSGEYRIKSRVLILSSFLSFFLLLYLGNLLNLQVVQGSVYKTRATEVTQRATVIPAMRGEFYDRNGDLPMVLNVDSFALKIIPAEVPMDYFPKLFSLLELNYHIPYSEWEKKIPPGLYKSYQEIELKDSLEYEDIVKVSEHIQEYPGVFWTSKPRRNYVESGSLSHIIGYVGNITQEELQILYNQGYSLSSVLGKTGLEKKYDQILRGTDGTRLKTVDVKGRQVQQDEVQEIPPQNGKDLILTIDRRIQKLAEEALGPRLGSVIVLKPATGEILAMVSYPYFDANLFYTDRASQEFNRLFTDPKLPFWNRATKSEYPPASTFKTIMGAAILEKLPNQEGNTLDPENQFFTCTGSIKIGDRVFKCWKHTGHGPQNLTQAIANSCNIYFYNAGYKYLGPDRISEVARSFGLGQITGVDLPGESSGLIPTPKWKQRNLNYPWLGGDTVNMSIGQGFTTVTPLQMADVIAMIVNEGVIYKPHFLKAIRDRATGKIEDTIVPEVLTESGLNPAIFKHLQSDLRGVVTWGTASYHITTKAVQVAGKTGTGEAGAVKGSNNHGWFVSYAPYDTPGKEDKIVVITQIEAANEVDDYWAPKAADIIYQGIFANQTYEEVKTIHRPWYLRQ